MIIGQILVYHYNGLHNAKPKAKRNIFTIKDVHTKEQFKPMIENALDEIPPGKGYVLAKYNDKIFICEKDTNNPHIGYVRHEVKYHPISNQFTI